MRFTTFVQVLVLAPFTAAFVIPKGTSDGVYVVHSDEQGNELHERLGPALTDDTASLVEKREEVSENPDLVLRQNRGARWHCGCGHQMNHAHCDSAVAALKADVWNKNGQFPARSNFYSIQGSVVAFVCNRGEMMAWHPGNMAGYFQSITDRCGWYTAGTYNSWDGNLRTLVGYMNYYNGLDYCGRSDSSNSHTC